MFEDNVKLIITTLVCGLGGDQLTEKEKDQLIDTYTKQITDSLPKWKPAASAYEGDRLPKYDFMLKRVVARDEEGIYYLDMDDLYTLPKKI